MPVEVTDAHSKSQAGREKVPTYYTWREHNYVPDLKALWFMDESPAQGVSERWSAAQVIYSTPRLPISLLSSTTWADKMCLNRSGIMLQASQWAEGPGCNTVLLLAFLNWIKKWYSGLFFSLNWLKYTLLYIYIFLYYILFILIFCCLTADGLPEIPAHPSCQPPRDSIFRGFLNQSASFMDKNAGDTRVRRDC